MIISVKQKEYPIMNLTIISGSHRPASNSLKIAKFIQSYLASVKTVSQAPLIDLSTSPLPFWDDSMWSADESPTKKAWAPLSKQLHASDGLIVITPEWHGMVPSALKNFFLYTSAAELAHKPALLVAVSAGSGGSYPIAELRQSSYKNNRLCYLPEHVIIRQADTVFNSDQTPPTDDEKLLQNRLQQAISLLLSYSKALRAVRIDKPFDLNQFPSGM